MSFLLCTACVGPGWDIDTSEADAAIYLDGRRIGQGEAKIPYRFYGASEVTVLPVRHTPLEDVRAPAVARIRLESPVSGWLFPLDFFLEAVRRGFASAPAAVAHVPVTAAQTTLAAGTRPLQTEDLRARAQQAERER